MLDDLGLGSAIQWQARQFSKITGIPVNVDISDMPAALPEPHRTGIYRVVQEALTNSARHAKANMIEISIESTDAGLLLTVRDDGVGFNPSDTQERGLGLIGMEERVNELGGHLSIESDDRNGTTLRAAIPVAAEMELYGDSSTLSR
jgi:signal transduction histidine kinase